TPVAAPPEPAVTEPPTTRIPATTVRIEAAGPAGDTGRRKWYFGAAAAAAAVAALVIALVAHDRSATAGSPETQVTNAINAYVKALSTGDLATLRTVTSGNLATFYKSLSDREFADVYRTAVKQKTIPVVDSVDAVQVTGKTAIAQVTAYTPDKPEKKAARNFNLQETNEGWTVTDAP
ncbi:MAG: transcriptional regulator, partial [Streptomycetaceae bacterium]|nr:transcriptional regulator [Streptomycetaceae bacterium]